MTEFEPVIGLEEWIRGIEVDGDIERAVREAKEVLDGRA